MNISLQKKRGSFCSIDALEEVLIHYDGEIVI